MITFHEDRSLQLHNGNVNSAYRWNRIGLPAICFMVPFNFPYLTLIEF